MRHHHRRLLPDFDSPFLWLAVLGLLVRLALGAVLLAAWLVLAVVVLPAAGIAKLCRDEANARRMMRWLAWL